MLHGDGSMTSTSSIPSSSAWQARSERRTPWWLTRSNDSEEVVIKARGSSPSPRSLQRVSDESLPPLQERARPSRITGWTPSLSPVSSGAAGWMNARAPNKLGALTVLYDVFRAHHAAGGLDESDDYCRNSAATAPARV